MSIAFPFKILLKEAFHYLKSANGRVFLKLCFKYGGKPRFTKTKVKVKGKSFSVIDVLSFLWQFHEIYFLESYRFRNSNDIVIYDLGANVGLSIKYFNELYPNARIVAYEPNPKAFECLKENTLDYGVEIHQKAIWINDGYLEMGMDNADSSSIHGFGNTSKVECVDIQRIIQNEKKIDLLKMDIEGAEVEVLGRAKDFLSNVMNIFIEYHSYNGQPQMLSSLLLILESNSFRYFIRDEKDRKSPLVSHFLSNEEAMDMQLNIYAYRAT